jgi:hypothetical protein
MSFEAYQKGMDEREKKDREIHELKEQMNDMGDTMKKLAYDVKTYKNEFELYVEQFGGRRLTREERQRIQEFRKEMDTLPDDDDDDNNTHG